LAVRADEFQITYSGPRKVPSICTIQHQRPRTSQFVQTGPLPKHTPRTRPRLDQTQNAGMAPVHPHALTFLGPESPTGVPTPPLPILPPARGPRGRDPHIPPEVRSPATASLIGETVAQINMQLQLFDALSWSSFTDTQRVSSIDMYNNDVGQESALNL
jgi:hypothetical protein